MYQEAILPSFVGHLIGWQLRRGLGVVAFGTERKGNVLVAQYVIAM